jgi:GxxExxY protein
MRELDEITGEVVDAAFRLHSRLGPGLFESVYETMLFRTIEQRGLRVERQKAITFEFDGLVFEDGFRIDLLVEQRVVVELKSVENLAAGECSESCVNGRSIRPAPCPGTLGTGGTTRSASP